MFIFALNFLLGIMVFSVKNTISLSTGELILFIAILMGILATFSRHKLIAFSLIFFTAGFSWMGLFSTHVLKADIDEQFFNTPIGIIGTIQELPQVKHNKTQFIFDVSKPFKGKLKLSWYGHNQLKLQSGDQWKLLVKIKHNNSYQNAGGFDYERWLFYKQFDATGYVKRSNVNQLITANSSVLINTVRQNIQKKLTDSFSHLDFIGVINALIIGDRSLIKDSHWQLFKDTNTTHLSVISGLHIGLISGFIFLLFSFFWRRCTICTLKLPASIFGAYLGLLGAFIYALIAGFPIPTQRAFIMAGVVFVSIILRRHHNTWQLYGGALLLVLISNPLSVFSAGFWLSFYVVAIIIYGIGQHKDKHWLFRLIYIQLLISVATLPLIAGFFSIGSIFSPIANLVAIPVFSFITTPFSLLGALFSYLHLQSLSELLFSIANQSLIYLSFFLKQIQLLEFNQWHYTPVSNFSLFALTAGIIFIVLPSALKLRKIALVLLAVVWLQPIEKLKHGEVNITTLDVGQGLSHVVRTQNHTLIFDTGARYRSGFNMGDAVILPYLQSNQINLIDITIISHGDNDHIGGLNSLLENTAISKVLTSIPEKISQDAEQCSAYPSWQWDGVSFKMLNFSHQFTGNNASCVLRISNDSHSIMLTGDIEKQAELHLIKTWGDKLKSDVLISPHHGSKTSSSDQFLSVVSPKWVVISSGYKNRFNHPAKIVTNRYQQHKINILKTSCAGQIDIKFSDQMTIERFRQTFKRYYWRECK